MRNLNWRKKACTIFLLCAATASAAPAQVFTTLVGFDGTNGIEPDDSLVQGFNGHLYGTTNAGGALDSCGQGFGCGTIFEVAPAGALTTLYSFCADGPPCSDGAGPDGLVLAVDGGFYGTNGGGVNGGGTFFKINPSGGLTTIYSYCYACAGGPSPSGIVQGAHGDFYGTTAEVGLSGGTVVRITSSGSPTTLYTFCEDWPSCPDGSNPIGLVRGTDGNFYGTTTYGGVNCSYPGCGTAFKITPSGALTTLHSFDEADGANPFGMLVQASDGNFYGTTSSGGAAIEVGTVFKITPQGKLTTLYVFCKGGAPCADGASPKAGLIQATDGNLYGITSEGGSNGAFGTIFKITLRGVLSTLHSFCTGGPPCLDGASPYAGLLQATDGGFYGTTPQDGPGGGGTVFRLSVGLGPFVSLVRNPAKVGQAFGILGQRLKGTTGVSLNGTPATFKVTSETLLEATVPTGATTGYVTVTTPSGTLTSNVPFHVIK